MRSYSFISIVLPLGDVAPHPVIISDGPYLLRICNAHNPMSMRVTRDNPTHSSIEDQPWLKYSVDLQIFTSNMHAIALFELSGLFEIHFQS